MIGCGTKIMTKRRLNADGKGRGVDGRGGCVWMGRGVGVGGGGELGGGRRGNVHGWLQNRQVSVETLAFFCPDRHRQVEKRVVAVWLPYRCSVLLAAAVAADSAKRVFRICACVVQQPVGTKNQPNRTVSIFAVVY